MEDGRLTNCDVSSLIIDSLCDRPGGQEVAVACFYFDFAARKEQSPTSALGALLKQLVRGPEEIPKEISLAYRGQRNVLDRCGLQPPDIVKMLQAAVSRKRTFICIDALDECVAGYRVKLLDSLNQVLQRSPGTRVFVTGRPHVQAEVGRRLSGRITTIHITPRRRDIISYLRTRLKEDTMPRAMDSRLEEGILNKIPGVASEMYVETTTSEELPQIVH